MPKHTEQLPPALWPDANEVHGLARYLDDAYNTYVRRHGTGYLAGIMACLNLSKHVVLDVGKEAGDPDAWRNLAAATFARMMEDERFDTQEPWIREVLEAVQGTGEGN
jgi:hypothetical protein